MPRLTRRLASTLLWVAIALLPLRGLAIALMPATMQPATTVLATAEAQAQAAAPCHDAAADAAPAVGDCPSCSLCALCHGSVAQAPSLGLPWQALPGLPPVAALPRAIEPRAPDGLFRPPRTLLA